MRCASCAWNRGICQRLKAPAEVCLPEGWRAHSSKSWNVERNHNCLKQCCMKGSLVEPELITVTAFDIGAQNFTASMILKSSKVEIWVAAEQTKCGKANVRHWPMQVAPPRTVQASMLKHKLSKNHSMGLITETLLSRGRNVFRHDRSWCISKVTGCCLACRGKLCKVFKRHETKIRLAWMQALTQESFASKDCRSLIVNFLHDSHRCKFVR